MLNRQRKTKMRFDRMRAARLYMNPWNEKIFRRAGFPSSPFNPPSMAVSCSEHDPSLTRPCGNQAPFKVIK